MFWSADTTAKWDSRIRSFAWWWMLNTERAVDTFTIFQGRVACTIPFIMTWLAKIVGTETVEESYWTAKLTLPIYLFFPMLSAFFLSDTLTYFLEKATLTNEIFFLCSLKLRICSFLFTVDKAAKVWAFTLIAKIKGAAMICKLLWSIIKVIFRVWKSWII